MLPKQYAWLAKEPGPNMLMHMLAIYGTKEFKGAANNPRIIAWADECGIKVYKHDAIAWCGLSIAVCAKRAGWKFNPLGNALWARNWASWGTPQPVAMLGDVLVFPRGAGGHVALYVGENDKSYFCLGGNQSDQVNIVTKPKKPILAIRRAPWRIAQPANVRRIFISAKGIASTKED